MGELGWLGGGVWGGGWGRGEGGYISATVPLGTSAFVDPLPFCLACPHAFCLAVSLASCILVN